MPSYDVTVSMKRVIRVFAADEEQAKEKAVELVESWNGITDAEALECTKELRGRY